MTDSISIAAGVVECLDRFDDCASVDYLKRSNWVANARLDFNYWVSSIGALAGGKASLDYRLQAADEFRVQSIIFNLLSLFAQLLEDCIVTARRLQDPQPSTSNLEWRDNPDGKLAEFQESITRVDGILKQLANLAVAIREAATPSRLSKADKSFEPECYQDLRVHLSLLIYIGNPCVRKAFENGRFDDDVNVSGDKDLTLNVIQQRLIDVNLRRRHRFTHAQARARRLAASGPRLITEYKEIVSISKPELDGEEHNYDPPDIAPDVSISKEAIAQAPLPDPSEFTVSTIINQIKIEPPRNPKSLSYARTDVSTTLSKVNYPAPPPLREYASGESCPCCCLRLPREVFERKHKWQNHLVKDLCPYTCILRNCSDPDKMYVSREEWLDHMREGHPRYSVWECVLCNSDPITQYHEAESMILHLRTFHPNEVLDPVSFVDVCEKDVPDDISSCPLCCWASEQPSEVSPTDLMDHIAEHIHSFSLHSLPWGPSPEHGSLKLSDSTMDFISAWKEGVEAARIPELYEWASILDPHPSILLKMQPTPHDVLCRMIEDTDDALNAKHSLTANTEPHFQKYPYFMETDDASNVASASTQGTTRVGDDEWSAKCNIPIPRNEFAQDCDHVMARINSISAQRGGPVILLGPSGVGKKRLAARYCRSLHDQWPNTSVGWINATSDETIEQGLHNLADQADIRRDDAYERITTSVDWWLAEVREQPWVIVLSDYCKEVISHSMDTAEAYGGLPPTLFGSKLKGCLVVITTRSPSIAHYLSHKCGTIVRLGSTSSPYGSRTNLGDTEGEMLDKVSYGAICLLPHDPGIDTQIQWLITEVRRTPTKPEILTDVDLRRPAKEQVLVQTGEYNLKFPQRSEYRQFQFQIIACRLPASMLPETHKRQRFLRAVCNVNASFMTPLKLKQRRFSLFRTVDDVDLKLCVLLNLPSNTLDFEFRKPDRTVYGPEEVSIDVEWFSYPPKQPDRYDYGYPLERTMNINGANEERERGIEESLDRAELIRLMND